MYNRAKEAGRRYPRSDPNSAAFSGTPRDTFAFPMTHNPLAVRALSPLSRNVRADGAMSDDRPADGRKKKGLSGFTVARKRRSFTRRQLVGPITFSLLLTRYHAVSLSLTIPPSPSLYPLSSSSSKGEENHTKRERDADAIDLPWSVTAFSCTVATVAGGTLTDSEPG